MSAETRWIAALAALVGLAGWAVLPTEGRVMTGRFETAAGPKPAVDREVHARTERAVFALG